MGALFVFRIDVTYRARGTKVEKRKVLTFTAPDEVSARRQLLDYADPIVVHSIKKDG